MLILITTCCQEGCIHCLHDARSDGYNMPLEICQDVIEFLKIVDPKLIQISGGEPTLHPKFVDIVESIANTFRRITVLVESNGSFFKYANRAKQVNRVLKIKNVHMQIRTHELYYPNYQEIVNNKILLRMPKTDVFHDHIRIFPNETLH